jgi:CubicO group peptidase (beta-lactamase class C family)
VHFPGTFYFQGRSKIIDDERGAWLECEPMHRGIFLEKGVIDLDTPLTKYTPERFLAGDPRLDLITARHVLSHSTGFPNWRSGELKINFTPGSQYSYSGEGYYYLQTVVTHLKGKAVPGDCGKFEGDLEVCGTDFPEFMKANLLDPFGMDASGYIWSERLEKQTSQAHDEKGKVFKKTVGTRAGAARYGSAGGLHTTPTDYAKFMIAVSDPPKTDAYHLKRETIQEMIRPHVKVVNGPYTSSWALGWQVQDNGLINHGGDNPGFHCHAIMSPKTKSGFVVMTNSDSGPALIQKLLGEKYLSQLT